VVTVSLRVPKGGLEVAAAGVRFKIAEHNKTTTATATFRGGQALTLSWYARPPKPRKLPARLYADTQTLVRVEQGLVRCTATIDFAILRSPVKQFKVDVPADFEFIRAQGEHVAATSLSEIRDPRARTRTATIDLRRGAIGRHTLTLVYERRLKKDETKLAVGVPSPLNVVQRRGSVGVAVHGGLEVTAVASSDARPVDVKKLPAALWGRATAPLIRGFRYDAGSPTVRLTVTQHKQVAVLVAMSDACEASTVVTPEGRVITKVMYILRNNQKQFMKLDLPEGATVWSTFVQDRPVTPVRNEAGQLLIPLRKSEEVTEEDEEEGKTYRWRRDKRRSDRRGELRVARERMQRAKRLERADEPPKDLKPYDVEIVFVTPNVKLDARGNVKLALPKADIPVGLMAWAVFLPQKLRVVDVAGNLKEVSRFALPFRHFGEAELMRREALATAQKAVVRAMLAEQLKELRRDTVRLAPHAKGALPVRIEIPITGAIQRFQKFLLVNEAPQVTLTYRRRAD